VENILASIAEELHQAHARLQTDLRKLENEAEATSTATLSQLRSHLQLTRVHVAGHFQFETQGGYMEALRNRQPRLYRTIGRLAEEHEEMMQSLDALIESSRRPTSQLKAIRERVRDWIDSVRSHERRENNLMQEAFDFDVGSETVGSESDERQESI
jgi:hemerythrin-like domain-containing protein